MRYMQISLSTTSFTYNVNNSVRCQKNVAPSTLVKATSFTILSWPDQTNGYGISECNNLTHYNSSVSSMPVVLSFRAIRKQI